jgi:Ion channel
MVITAAALLGLLLLALTAQDAFEVMLLPRRVLRRVRFVSFFYRLTWAAWSAFTRHLPRNQREHLLGVFGPLSMALLFGVWVTGLTLGFGLLLWAAESAGGKAGPPKLGNQLYMSGVTFFTLGYGDVVPHTGFGRVLTVWKPAPVLVLSLSLSAICRCCTSSSLVARRR